MIRRELGIFLVVGLSTVLIDFLTYRGLLWLDLAGVDMAKATGFLTGTVYAYFANRLWTFGHKTHASGSVWRFVVLYALTLAANVAVNALALRLLADVPGIAIQLAFLVATTVSAALNFCGMKWFVFKAGTASEQS